MTRVTCYLCARYDDPTIGRFLTRDPLPGSVRDPSFPEGLNAYPYVRNNPVNRVDPTGMLSEDVEVLPLLTMDLFGVPIEDLLRLWQAGSCGGAQAQVIVGAIVAVLAITAMWTAPGPSLWLGGPLFAYGLILMVQGQLGIQSNCGAQDTQ